MQYYCSKCGIAVWPRKLGFMFSLFGDIEDYCDECGESTKTAIFYSCENGHTIGRYDKFCKKCGAKRSEIKIY